MCWNSLSVVCGAAFCALLTLGPFTVLAQHIKANYDYGDNYKIGEYKMKLTLTCTLDDSDSKDSKYTWKWLKSNNAIETDNEDPHHVEVSGNTLTISRALESDAGEYTCQLLNAEDKKLVKHKVFIVVLKPYVRLPDTATFIEGEKMELECIVFGVPTPTVSWEFKDKPLTASGNISFLENKRKIPNSLLVLNSVTMENRGEFVCIGKNDAVMKAVRSNPSYVRIKDKMAALWPFLGICAEVIILCLIIFIYEKKRNKAEFEESDTDQGPETNNANDLGGGDVRHRK